MSGSFPPVPPSALPALAGRVAVLIAPYAELPVTRAMQPLKLKEYLATGKPVVVRKLPATEEWADCCDVWRPEGFASAVLKLAKAAVRPVKLRKAAARRGKLGRENRVIRAMGG